MSKVLVTGGTGFVGKQVLKLLDNSKFEIHAVTRDSNKAFSSRVCWHELDLLQPEEIESLMRELRPTLLIHLAWDVDPQTYWHSENNFIWVKSTLALAHSFQRYGGKRMVTAGTCAEYDWIEGELTEDFSVLSQGSLYSSSKNRLFALLQQFAQTTEMSLAWCRLFFLYGPFESSTRLVPSVICSLLDNRDAGCSEGSQRRDYMHVKDAARAIVTIFESEMNGAVNIASGHAVSIRSVVQEVARQLGKEDSVNFAIEKSDVPPLVLGNADKLKSLGWRPNYTLQTGIADTISWWRTQVKGG
ncbi:NAD-dependent epimerase/dehydratase family protein [Cohnella endophytica]|nr:NAD(P)-dependent oxidoreductase [Cohnella endophytica]